MIKIKLPNKTEATFSGVTWKSDDKDVQKMLNSFLDLDEVSVSDAYRTSTYDRKVHGLDSVVLDSVGFLEPEVLEYEEDKIPKEEKGVVV